MYIPLEERETIITFNEKEPTASVYTMNGALIRKLDSLVQRQGYTLIPLSVYLKEGRMKLELGLCKGKQLHDKRDDMAHKDAQREIQRAFRDAQKR